MKRFNIWLERYLLKREATRWVKEARRDARLWRSLFINR